jgi:hypothetical protein
MLNHMFDSANQTISSPPARKKTHLQLCNARSLRSFVKEELRAARGRGKSATSPQLNARSLFYIIKGNWLESSNRLTEQRTTQGLHANNPLLETKSIKFNA